MCLALVLLVTGCQVSVGGQERPLVRHGRIHGSFEVDADRSIQETKSSGGSTKNTIDEMSELLRLETSGDIFHPNLMLFDTMLAFGLRQHRYDSNGETDRGTGDLQEYRFHGRLLEKKPYPVSFYLDRYEDLIPRQFSSSLLSLRENRGISMALHNEQWPMNFSYSESHSDQEGQSGEDQDRYVLDDNRFRYSLDHDFTELSQLRFEFERRDVTQERFDSTIHWIEDRYNFRHSQFFDEGRGDWLESYLTVFDQTGDYELEQILWTERLRLRHTEDFNTYYGFSFSESNRPNSQNDEARLETGFSHYLYESLDTTGRLYVSEQNSDDIQIDRFGGNLNVNYHKINPWGQLTGTYSVSFENLDQTGGGGQASVTDERHLFLLLGTLEIQLDQLNIDPTTIIVWDSTRTKQYFDYNVIQTNGLTDIQIIPGGDITDDGDQTLSFDYDYQTQPDRTTDSATQRFTIRQMFHNGISIYYEHGRRNESIDSTEPVVPDEYTTNTYGTDYQNKGLRLLAEYTDEDSTRSPFTRKRLAASYLWLLDRDTSLSLFATNDWVDYTTEDPYDITLFSAGGELLARLTTKYSLASTVYYRDEEDSRQGPTQGYDWDTELRYRFRQLTYSTGFEFSFLDYLGTETDNVRWYFRLRREF